MGEDGQYDYPVFAYVGKGLGNQISWGFGNGWPIYLLIYCRMQYATNNSKVIGQ
jgi:hypothetical protein